MPQKISKRTTAASVSLIALAGAALGATVMATAEAQDNRSVTSDRVAPVMAPSFADLIEHVSPAVVSVEVTTEVSGGVAGLTPDALPPGFEEFLERFGQAVPEQQPRQAQGAGSGFFISSDGLVVTNYHVVENATEISISLKDGRELDAEIVGTDEPTDLALLRVEGDEFPFVQFDTDPHYRVGDWVVAVGNPFGLGGTATAGIISARGRDINANAYDDFLQIDAAVNRGNSGGPAFDTTGKVVGVNTAIYSPNGGNVGIAFAIPASVVKQVVFDLMDDGNVTRGYLGVSIQDVSPDIASSVGLERATGALVTEPRPDGPAQKAGVQSGDIILRVNGDKIDDARDLARLIAQYDPETEVTLNIWRSGERIKVKVKLAQLEQEQALVETVPEEEMVDPTEPVETETGLVLIANEEGEGLLVVDIDPDSAAAEKGFAPGDVILEANSEKVSSVADFEDALAAVKDAGRSTMLIKVNRDGNTRFVGLPLE